jgi:hypothetical protein
MTVISTIAKPAYVYDATADTWFPVGAQAVAFVTTYVYTATAAQTVFSGVDDNSQTLSYITDAIKVFLNGALLTPYTDYSASNGTSVTLASGASVNDILVIIASDNFQIADTYTIAQADTAIAAAVTGAGGLRLVTPTSIANSGGSASVSGGEVTFTGVTSLSLNGVFTSTYDNYKVMIDATTSANNSINFRLRVGGVDASGSNYVLQYLNVNNAALAAARVTATSISLMDTNTPIRSAAVCEIISPSVAQATNFLSFNQYSVLSAGLNLYAGTHSLSTAYDGITLYPSTGTISGKIRIYGYQNS